MSRVPQEWGKNPSFFFGNRESFKDMATDDVFPRWLRVTFAAYAHFGANGHATFRQKRLAWLLGEKVGEVMIPTSRQRVREAIDGAVDRGLLMPESKALCLVLPSAVVAFGVGKEGAACPRHPARRNGQTVSPTSETTRFQPVVSTPKERQNRVVSGSAPLFSLTTPTGDDRDSADPDERTA
ncbi:hypothetical protein D0Z08_05865 [Nocardioides immobilis]|uniref:Uncharacterized protein n=1 Tax=Nocardioides immobilis TaxID=2049295 RepID=A0A417Y578_9ACTN|nr:hypothetical protein [Nocardioides immobilis]RHW27823.1 hypothetical protein D0Z08_05865 [Nocardioides immobilis]